MEILTHDPSEYIRGILQINIKKEKNISVSYIVHLIYSRMV